MHLYKKYEKSDQSLLSNKVGWLRDINMAPFVPVIIPVDISYEVISRSLLILKKLNPLYSHVTALQA